MVEINSVIMVVIENTDALKGWLISCLSNMCDADPAALAKYVLALVKKDKNENELREFCLDQLDVFLLKHTKTFVDLLFETLKKKSYLPKPDLPTNESNSGSSPVCNNVVTVKTSSFDSNLNESIKNDKTDIDNRLKDPVNSDSGKSKVPHKTSSTKSRSGSPVRKFSRQRSRSREVEDGRKRCATDICDDRNKRPFLSKKPRIQKHGYFKSHKRRNVQEEADKDMFRKSRSRSNSWDKHRSRSCSWSSHSSSHSSSRSRSRERSKERSSRSDSRNASRNDPQKSLLTDHGDTDYRQKHPVVSTTHLQTSNSYKGAKRCQDYDEKGYCMRGDLCLYDHGTDPLVVEDVSVLNPFGVPVSQGPLNDNNASAGVIPQPDSKSTLQPPPPTSPPPPLPPPPPPLPPLPPPTIKGAFAPEPYNPEAPGMNVAPREHMNYWVPPNIAVHHIPPPHHSPGPPPLSGMPNVLFNINEPPPYHNAKPQRKRELIGVPTIFVDDNSSCYNVLKVKNKDSDKISVENLQNMPAKPHLPINEVDRTSGMSVQGKRITEKKGFDYSRLGPTPKKLKMGNNRNTLEVRKIPKHLNSIALLNSHFSKFGKIVNIQVGYDGDPEAALVQFMNHSEATAAYRSTDAILNNRFIKVFWHNKNEEPNVLTELKLQEKAAENINTEANIKDNFQNDLQKTCDKTHERSVVFSSKGIPKKTVFNPAALKKSNMVSTPVVPVTRRQLEEQRKDTLHKRLELHKKKQEFLECQLHHQKVILEKLDKCKNDKEKNFLKKTLKDMNGKISDLQNAIRKESEDLKNLFQMMNEQPYIKTELAEKELLDAEMDLYNKQHRGDDIAELLSRVNELKQKAHALGLLDGSPHVQTGAKHGKLRFLNRNSVSQIRSIDHRPRKILVSGFNDKDSVLKHFQQFNGVEKIEENELGLIATFRTRAEAEGAVTAGTKFGDKTLSLSWLQDTQTPTSESSEHNSVTNTKSSDLPVVDEDEDEDEEEDSEARSWRR